jgi:hypothetical protein
MTLPRRAKSEAARRVRRPPVGDGALERAPHAAWP